MITHDEIGAEFDDRQIKILANDTKLNLSPDQLHVFGRAIRAAVADYLTAVQEPSQQQIQREVETLWRAAAGADRSRLINALAGVSEYTRSALNRRGAAFPDAVPIELPTVEALKEGKISVPDAARAILALVSLGAHAEDGRRRPGDRRSRTIVPHVFVPVSPQVDRVAPDASPSTECKRREPRRSAERDLVVGLRLAWIEAAELDRPVQRAPQGPEPAPAPFRAPAGTAARGREGPFAALVNLVFDGIGITGVNVVEIINSVAEAKKNQKSSSGRA